MAQKALIVKAGDNWLYDLNRDLERGWKVVQVCPMPSSASVGDQPSTCLVILERDK